MNVYIPGQKAMEGLFPICIEVEAEVSNPEKGKSLKGVVWNAIFN